MNDAPVVAPQPQSGVAGNAITLKPNPLDVDGDVLSYVWAQTGGETLEFTPTNENITVTPSSAGTYTFTVIANDGKLQSNTGELVLTVKSKPDTSSGGALGWLTALLLPLAAMRRRMK